MGNCSSELLIPEDENDRKFYLSQPTTCKYVDAETDLCNARLWERCFSLRALKILAKHFQWDELRTCDVGVDFVKPVTAASSTNFVHAFVDGKLDFTWMPPNLLPNMTEDEVDALVDEVGKNIGPATVFVSHPWNMKFKELIFMLERLEKQLVEKGTVTHGDPAGVMAVGDDAKVAAATMPFKAKKPPPNLPFKKTKPPKSEAAAATEQHPAPPSEAGPVTESYAPVPLVATRDGPGPVTESTAQTPEAANSPESKSQRKIRRASLRASVVGQVAGAKGKGAKKDRSYEPDQVFFFLDLFAVRQAYDQAGCGIHNHHMVPDYQFAFAIRKAEIFAMACDPWFDPMFLRRSWCMHELAHAHKLGKPVELMMGSRYYALAEASGEDRMAGVVERLKFARNLSDAIRDIRLETTQTSERREAAFLKKATTELLGDAANTVNGTLRRALLVPLGRMNLLDVTTVNDDYPDTPPLATPAPEEEEEPEEEDAGPSTTKKVHMVDSLCSGELAQGKYAEMIRSATVATNEEGGLPPEATLPRATYRDDSKWTLEGHLGSVWCCCFSPDGKLVASGGTGGLIKVWTLATGLEKCTLLGHKGAVLCIAWSQYTSITGDGPPSVYGRIVSGGEDKTVKVWDTVTGLLVATCYGHVGGVNCLAIDPVRMNFMITGGRGRLLKVWSIHGGPALQTLEGHKDMIQCVAIAPNGEWAISGSVDRTVKVWDCLEARTVNQRFEVRTTLYDHRSSVWACCVSTTGKYFITGSSDCTIKVWSAFHCVLHANFNVGHYVYHLSLSLDGRTLAAVCNDNTLKLFDVSSAKNKGKCKAMYKPSRRSYWNTEDGKPPPGALTFPGQSDAADKQHSVTMWCCDISPDGNYIVSSGDDCRLKIWDTKKTVGFRNVLGESYSFIQKKTKKKSKWELDDE